MGGKPRLLFPIGSFCRVLIDSASLPVLTEGMQSSKQSHYFSLRLRERSQPLEPPLGNTVSGFRWVQPDDCGGREEVGVPPLKERFAVFVPVLSML